VNYLCKKKAVVRRINWYFSASVLAALAIWVVALLWLWKAV
jgi:hypothetical protein